MDKFLSIIRGILKLLFGLVPATVLLCLGLGLAFSPFQVEMWEHQFGLLFGMIGATATMAALSLGASGVSDKPNKLVYLRAGECLFHAAVLFIIATLIKAFDFVQMHKITEHASEISTLDALSMKIFQPMIWLSERVFFMWGVAVTVVALSWLNWTLFKSILLVWLDLPKRSEKSHS